MTTTEKAKKIIYQLDLTMKQERTCFCLQQSRWPMAEMVAAVADIISDDSSKPPAAEEITVGFLESLGLQQMIEEVGDRRYESGKWVLGDLDGSHVSIMPTASPKTKWKYTDADGDDCFIPQPQTKADAVKLLNLLGFPVDSAPNSI